MRNFVEVFACGRGVLASGFCSWCRRLPPGHGAGWGGCVCMIIMCGGSAGHSSPEGGGGRGSPRKKQTPGRQAPASPSEVGVLAAATPTSTLACRLVGASCASGSVRNHASPLESGSVHQYRYVFCCSATVLTLTPYSQPAGLVSPKRKAITTRIRVNFCATFSSGFRGGALMARILAGLAIPGPPGKSTKS